RVSNLSEGRIIRKVTPVYPSIAKRTGIQGQVVLEAVISRAGRIENLRAISGHPWLAEAARVAVNQWEVRPYILNGTPIEVVTQITVDYNVNQEGSGRARLWKTLWNSKLCSSQESFSRRLVWTTAPKSGQW